MKTITSPANPLIKKIVALHTKEGRAQHGLCIAEGERALAPFLEARIPLEVLCITEIHASHPLIKEHEALTHIVSDACMKKISTATTPSGIVGIFKIPALPTAPLAQGIVCAQIQDPGNMGTLIRTAVALCMPTIVVVEGVDPWSPKVIQASAGTLAYARIYRMSWPELIARKGNAKLIALTVRDGADLESLDTRTSLLVVGNEAHGLPEAWQNDCDTRATIPMPGNTESLNVAVAGSIALYICYRSGK